MYRILVSVIAFCFISGVAIAQNQKTQDSLMKVMVAEACDEIKKKDFSSIKREELEMEIGMAVVPVFSNHADDIRDILNLDVSDGENMKDFGQKLGVKLAVECPAFMRIIAGNKSFVEGVKKDNNKSTSYSISGTLLKVVSGDLTYFLIKDKQGKTEKIWWMEYFEGADKLAEPKNLNKSVVVRYKESEVYSAVIKDYIKIKIATRFDK